MRTTTVAAAALLSLALGCGGGDDPAAEELYGRWANLDAGVYRVWHFEERDAVNPDVAGRTDVFHLYLYDEGSTPTEIQRGFYSIQFGRLVQEVRWDTDGTLTGMTFGNDIYAVSDDSFRLMSSSPDGRRFERVDELP